MAWCVFLCILLWTATSSAAMAAPFDPLNFEPTRTTSFFEFNSRQLWEEKYAKTRSNGMVEYDEYEETTGSTASEGNSEPVYLSTAGPTASRAINTVDTEVDTTEEETKADVVDLKPGGREESTQGGKGKFFKSGQQEEKEAEERGPQATTEGEHDEKPEQSETVSKSKSGSDRPQDVTSSRTEEPGVSQTQWKKKQKTSETEKSKNKDQRTSGVPLKNDKFEAFVGGTKTHYFNRGKPCFHEFQAVPSSGSLRLANFGPRLPDFTCLLIFRALSGFILNVKVTEEQNQTDIKSLPQSVSIYKTKNQTHTFSLRTNSVAWTEFVAEEDIHLYITSSIKHNYFVEYYHTCGAKLVAEPTTKVIYSHPQYGRRRHDDPYSCSWTITAPKPNFHIGLIFKNLKFEQCCDQLSVYNAAGEELLASDEQETWPPMSLLSTSDSLNIVFESNGAKARKGFELVYFTVERKVSPPP